MQPAPDLPAVATALASESNGPATAPVVLLLHGFMGSRLDWRPVAEILARTHRCIAVDLPGHGQSGAVEESLWTPEGCAAALAGLLEAVGGGSVVGYSLGGRLALQLALEYPRFVARAVIVSASPGIADTPSRQGRREEDERRARRLETLGLEPFLDSWYRQPLFAPLHEHPRFPEVLARRRRNDPLLLARSLRTMGAGSQRSLWADLPTLGAPLLLLAGERDDKYLSIALDTVALCPRAEAVILRGRGHALIEEDPWAVARETAAFLALGPAPSAAHP